MLSEVPMVSWRACSNSAKAGCGALVPAGVGKCSTCRQAAEIERGRPAERGYDGEYRKARKVALAGATHCFRCGELFTAANPATGGHRVAIVEGGTTADGIGAECARCNYGRSDAVPVGDS